MACWVSGIYTQCMLINHNKYTLQTFPPSNFNENKPLDMYYCLKKNGSISQLSYLMNCTYLFLYLGGWAEMDRRGHAWGASRWRKSKMRRSPSSPQIHQKYTYMKNNPYRTPTERWQKTSDPPNGKKLPMYLGRAKEKRKNRDKRIGTGPAPVGGSCEGGKVSTH